MRGAGSHNCQPQTVHYESERQSRKQSSPYDALGQLEGGKVFFTIKEVVATGLCSRQTLWHLMKSGEIGHLKVGTRVLIPRAEIIRFVRDHYSRSR